MSNFRNSLARLTYPLSRFYHTLFPGIRILMYHRVARFDNFDQLSVSPEKFEQQIAYLAKNHRVISMDQAVTELGSQPLRSGVVVTFDDGYLDNLQNAMPILEKYQVPATIFVTSGFCDQELTHPRYLTEKNRVHLNWDEVSELANHPLVTIGAHTVTHPHLTRISSEQSRREIIKSKLAIEQKTGKTVSYFCYPSGDFGDREVDTVNCAGFRAAVSVGPGANHSLFSPYRLKRTEVTDKDDVDTFHRKMSGAFDIFHIFLHWRRMHNFRKVSQARSQVTKGVA